MSKLYGKEILNSTRVELNGESVEVYALNDGEYISYHVLSDKFAKDELNTLQLEDETDKADTSDQFLTCQGIEFLLWDQFYGKDDKLYSFSCEVSESTEL